MSDETSRYYVPSSAVPATGIAILMVGGLVSAVALSAAHSALSVYLTFEILKFAYPFAFGAALGGIVRGLAYAGHVRNLWYTRLVAAAIGLAGVYAAWVWFFRFFPLPNAFVFGPEELIQWMQLWADVGPWRVRDWQPTGWQMYAFWIAEAVCIVAFTVALSADPARAYCESCRCWTVKRDEPAYLPIDPSVDVRAELENENYTAIAALLKQPIDLSNRLDLVLRECPHCGESNYLTVRHTVVSHNKKGEEQVVSQDLAVNLIVPLEFAETVMSHAPADAISEMLNDLADEDSSET